MRKIGITVTLKMKNARISYIPNNFNIMDAKKRSYKDLQIQASKEYIKNQTLQQTFFYLINETNIFNKLNIVKKCNTLIDYKLTN